MKKFAVLFAALLQSFLAYSQEAESDNGQFLLVPRVDAGLNFNPSTHNGGTSFDLGDSSFYTLIEGSFGESDFSYSVANHWLSTDPGSLYSNTFRSDDLNWVDWAYVNYAPGAFDFTIGKNMVALGTFEEDEYDYNSYSVLSSSFWNNFQCYQLGASMGWTSPDEGSYLELQLAASPYSEHPFDDGLMTYSLRWTGDYGIYGGIWSVNAVDTGAGLQKMVLSGSQFSIGDNWTAGLDAYAIQTPFGSKDVLNYGLIPTLSYDNGGKFSAAAKVIYEDSANHSIDNPLFEAQDALVAGLSACWYPLAERSLKIHGLAAYGINDNIGLEGLYLGLGATYFLDLKRK